MRRVGVALTVGQHLKIDEVVDLARLAETLGYDSIWVPETWGTDLVSVLAILARETGEIGLGSGIFNVYSRSPALLAQTAATLHALSGGRFLLGLGASGPIVVERWHGLPYTRPLERTREYVEIIRQALRGDRVDHRGPQFELAGFKLLNAPETEIRIYIAALGPGNVRLTGEIADGWLPIFAPRGHLGPLRAQLEEGAAAAGRHAAAIDVAAYVPALVGRRAERLLRQQIAYYVGGMGRFYYTFVSELGFGAEARTIRDNWEADNRIGAVNAVSDRLLDLCTLGSDGEGSRRKVDDYHAEGVDLPILALPHGCTVAEAKETIETLAPGRTES